MTLDRPSISRAPLVRRRLSAALTIFAWCASAVAPGFAWATGIDESIAELRLDWEVVQYQTPAAEREKRFQALAVRAHQISENYPGRSEPLIWEGIILSSEAGERHGFAAISLARQAKALYEAAIQIDGSALDGLAYDSLGMLYFRMPGWPWSFGDKDKAKELLEKALSMNPNGIEPNYCLGEYLLETRHAEQAVPYLERALQAPLRPGRQIADTGRREEVRQLLDKAKGR